LIDYFQTIYTGRIPDRKSPKSRTGNHGSTKTHYHPNLEIGYGQCLQTRDLAKRPVVDRKQYIPAQQSWSMNTGAVAARASQLFMTSIRLGKFFGVFRDRNFERKWSSFKKTGPL
jgi:hypothetical protein